MELKDEKAQQAQAQSEGQAQSEAQAQIRGAGAISYSEMAERRMHDSGFRGVSRKGTINKNKSQGGVQLLRSEVYHQTESPNWRRKPNMPWKDAIDKEPAEKMPPNPTAQLLLCCSSFLSCKLEILFLVIVI